MGVDGNRTNMSYATRSHSRRFPLLLVLTGVGLAAAGLVCVLFSIYLAGLLDPAAGSQGSFTIGQLILDPLSSVFEGGFLTLGGGWVLMILGGVSLLFP